MAGDLGVVVTGTPDDKGDLMWIHEGDSLIYTSSQSDYRLVAVRVGELIGGTEKSSERGARG